MIKLVILVPTRNRSALAAKAVDSILNTEAPNILVMLSDNSTSVTHSYDLTNFVAQRGDPRLQLIRPPQSMSMSKHWNWAIGQSATGARVTHITVLTDRMMFKTGSIDALLRLIERYPNKIISYDHDRVVDHCDPITVDLNPWSDETLVLTAQRLLSLSAGCNFPSSLPRILNSVVPCSFLERNIMAYGSVVGSMSPDYSFCYRTLALIDSIVYWDRAPLFHYALGQSNGESFSRGVETEANSDFMSSIRGTVFEAAPCPGIRTVGNAMIHEFCVVGRTSYGAAFPPVDIAKYVQMLREEIATMENRTVAIDLERVLSEWYDKVGQPLALQQSAARSGGRLRRLARTMRIGSTVLRAHRFLTSPSPRAHEESVKPMFTSLESAIKYASANNGVRMPSQRLTLYQ